MAALEHAIELLEREGYALPATAAALRKELADLRELASMQPQPLEATLLVKVGFKPGHYPSERRARELFRLYLQLRAIFELARPFGGTGVPRVARLMETVERRLEEWANDL